MSDDSNVPTPTDWEQDGFEATMDLIARSVMGLNGTDLGLVRGLVNGQPVPVVVAAFPQDNPDPDNGTTVTTPIAVLLLGDVADLVTYPESVGTVTKHPRYVDPPVPASV